jgi:Prefoldin, molecular chaperone implicated in de novo protein folding, alpha subunit
MYIDVVNFVKTLANFQFGLGIGDELLSDDLVRRMSFKFSKKTGRLKYVFLDNKPYLSIRTNDGFITLSILAAKIILERNVSFKNIIVVDGKFSHIIKHYKQVPVKFVKQVDMNLKAGSEVIVVDENRKLIGVGKSILNGEEMLSLKRGIAVKLRKVTKNV